MCFLLSKRILTLSAKDDPPPHPKALQLQRMVRYTATLFVQVRPSSNKKADPIRTEEILREEVGNNIFAIPVYTTRHHSSRQFSHWPNTGAGSVIDSDMLWDTVIFFRLSIIF